MKALEYGAWPTTNIGKGGSKSSYSEFNKEFKKEKEKVREFGTVADEFYYVPEVKEFGQKKYDQKTNKFKRSDKVNKIRQQMIKQVVMLAAGAVVITTSYNSVIAEKKAQEAAAQSQDTPEVITIELSPDWVWSEDKQTVVLKLSDSDGNLVKELPASVEISTIEATCTEEGTKTYTASVTDEDKTYTDSKSESLDPLGHEFGEGKQTVKEDGQTTVIFECDRCHEQFKVEMSLTENE